MVATVAKKICDLCRTPDNVDEMMVVYRYQESAPWAVDLCAGCYEDLLGALRKVSRPAKRANVKPQYRIVETILTPVQLGD